MRRGIAMIMAAAAVAGAAMATGAAVNAQAPMPAQLHMTTDGPILFTPDSRALYLYSNENVSGPKFRFTCTDAPPNVMNDAQSGLGERPAIGHKFIKSCLQKFNPYLAGADAKPTGDFTIIDRPGFGRQWVYKGFPLYTSVKDRRPFERNGANAMAFGGGRGGGVRFASPPLDLPFGVKFERREEGLVLASAATQRPLYTPPAGARLVLAGNGREEFKPLVAPAIATVRGDWSIVDAGAGRKQFSYEGKPLFMAPAGMADHEIADAGEWETVIVVKGGERPSAIGKQMILLGEVFATARGMTLYTYNCNASGGGGGPRLNPSTCDDSGDPAQFMVALCGDGKECARRWRPYMASQKAKPVGDFSIVDITYPMFTDMHGALYPSDAPKAKVWAYRGKPLFTYHEDVAPGDMWGDNTAGIWGSSFSPAMIPGRSAIFE